METVSRRILSACFRLVLLLALCASLVSGCTTPPGGTPAGTATPPTLPTFPTAPSKTAEPKPPTGPVVAYRASTEIGVVDGTEVFATAPGSFAFARSADGNVVSLDVRTKATRVIPLAQAPRLGTGGESTIVWWELPNRLMQLDLADALNAAGIPAERFGALRPGEVVQL